MNWNKWIRQFHRWMSMTFTVTVILVIVAFALGEPVAWVPYVPLFPLALLLFSGLYLFVLPYLAKSGAANAAGQRGEDGQGKQ